MERVSLWELFEGNLEVGLLYWEIWKVGLTSTQRQVWKLILGFSLTVKTGLLFFNRTQSRVVIGLFLLNGTDKQPLCRRCGAEEEASAHILCEWEALALFRHTYLGSFLLDPEDVKESKSGANWNFSQGTGLSWLGIRLWGTNSLSKDLCALGLKGLELNYDLHLPSILVFVLGKAVVRKIIFWIVTLKCFFVSALYL
jgi:hypothetical protein